MKGACAEELILLFKDRPAFVKVDGWTVSVSVKDAEYWRVLKEWKRRMIAAHPDKGGSCEQFNAIMGKKMQWQHREAKEYAELGLLPPDGFRGQARRVERVKRLKGGRG